ncbi:MAG TPA: endonuclease VII domain-containing protein [Candidatus Paceibacterota bacterium]
MLNTYGLALGEYDALKASQNGTCAICQRATGAKKKLAVDHDHKTGYVRGLLCGPCNGMLGKARDDVEFFLRAAEYLKNPPAHTAIGLVKPK